MGQVFTGVGLLFEYLLILFCDMAELNSSPKEKWKMLRTLIREKKLNVQHRRQHTFGLFKSRKMERCELCSFCNVESVDNYMWLEYTSEESPQYRLAVRLVCLLFLIFC